MRLRAAILTLVLAAGTAGCSRNPVDVAAAHERAGDAFAADGRSDEAILEYRTAIQATPRAGQIHRKLAEAYERARDFPKALAAYVRAADLLPDDAAVQVRAGELLIAAGKFEDARTRIAPTRAKDPRNIAAQLVYANALAGMKDVAGAIKEIEEAIALEPGRPEAYANLGVLQFVRGSAALAEREFLHAIQVDPRSIATRLALANLYFSTQRPQQGFAEVKKALELDPQSVLANRTMVVSAIVSGRPAEAEPYLKTLAATGKDPSDSIRLADFYVAMRRYGDAAATLRSLAARPDSYIIATTRLAGLAELQGLRSEAWKLVGDALYKDIDAAAPLVMKARLQLAEGQRQAALTTLTRATSLRPEDIDARFVLGQVLAANHEWDKAAQALYEVLQRNPRALSAQILVGRVELTRLNPDAAIQAALAVLQLQPADRDARAVLVRALLLKGEFATAERELAPLMKQTPASTEAESIAATLRLARNDRAGARLGYERALAINPANLEAVAGLARVGLAEGRSADAIAAIDSALAHDAKNAALQVLAARTFVSAGDFARAERALRAAIKLDADSLEAYGLLGGLFVMQNRLEDARREFAELARQQPLSVAAHTFLATVLEAQGKGAAAEQEYRRALDVDRGAVVAANNLAWAFADSNRNLDEALELARTAKRRMPDDSHVNDTLGWVLYQKRMYTQAIEAFTISVKRDPANPGSQYRLGLAHFQNGDIELARQHLKQALKLKPDFDRAADAKKKLAEIGGL